PVAQQPASAQPVAQQSASAQPVAQQPAWKRHYSRGDDISESYPHVQWVNRGTDLEPQQPIGGFASPIDQDVPLPNSIYSLLRHPNGKSTEVLYTDQLEIAVLRRRFYWFDPGTGELLEKYRPGARGKTQFLCYIKCADGTFGPVKLTFTGLAGAYFNAARHEFAKAVRKATGGKAPSYVFWMRVAAGQPIWVGKGDHKSLITPPMWDRDFDPDRDFIGSGMVDAICWDEVDRWAEVYRPKMLNGDSGEEYEEAVEDTF
ncbi:hypothetical protein, partial [Thermogutta sp.]|uniref:hypothetical protein n=1 Tax=Thermogutta sp. TaxID=1962930 RepID=UPI003220903E